jgi:DNA (cytosine-5)-methyltransferase 1
LHGDITQIDAKDVPDCDVLVGGFPCQSFSVAGKRGGFDDARGTLFFEVARILAEKKPKVVLLENVKGLVGHDKGRTLNTIVTALNECGYTVDFEVLNSKYFGVPQNRDRIFIVGVLNGEQAEWHEVNDNKRKDVVAKGKRRIAALPGVRTFNFDWPAQEEVTTRLRDVLEDDVDERFYLSEKKTAAMVENLREREKEYLDERNPDDINACYSPDIAKKNQNGRRIKPNDDPMCALTGRDRHGVVEPVIFGGGGREQKVAIEQFTQGGGVSCCVDANYSKGTAPGDVGKGRRTHVLEPQPTYRIRKLTPRECFRLQGFADAQHDALEHAGISNSQRYKLAGNAVTVNVIEALGERLLPLVSRD